MRLIEIFIEYERKIPKPPNEIRGNNSILSIQLCRVDLKSSFLKINSKRKNLAGQDNLEFSSVM